MLTPEQVEHIARLAKLDLAPEEKESFAFQLSSVLDYVSQLQDIDTEGVEPMSYPVALENVWGEDEPKPFDGAVRDGLLAAFPEKEGDLLKVKAVFN